MKFFFVSPYIPLLFFLFVGLQACASRQEPSPQVEIQEPKQQTQFSAVALSRAELNALNNSGQVDRDVPEEAMEDVAVQYKYYLRQGRKVMCALSRQSEPYLAYARQVFKEKGMPEELANLAIVESGYKPGAVSKAGAVGAWQFMRATGTKYGLSEDMWKDERLDPYRATEAAGDYLQNLYGYFGDWPTAIAAYNAGEGKILRAKERTGGKNFFEVKELNHILDEKAQLRQETKDYVPRFIAVTKIMRSLPELGFDPIEPEKQPEVRRLTAKPGTDLTAVSKACNLPWSEFKSYNLHHKYSITSPEQSTFVYVPSRVEKLAADYLCTVQTSSYAGWRPVKVKNSNDSLEKISRRSGAPLNMLMAANPGHGRLRSGQIILAPISADMSARTAGVSREKTGGKDKAPVIISSSVAGTEKGGKGGVHILRNKDTLFSIAKRYNISVSELQAHNGISDPSKLHVGQKLKIPGMGQKAASAGPHAGGSTGRIGTPKRKSYVVRAKDNLWCIARRHNISVNDLKRWNSVNEKNLQPGLQLIVSEN